MLEDWINIFKTGTHTSSRGITNKWTLSDLKQIVANFNENDRVPIVVGHPKDNSPAYGWISALKIEGDKLMAKLADVNDSFKKAVEAGLYRNRSVSIAKTENGFQLVHLGWLGGVPPAVEGLEPIGHSIDAEIDIYEFSSTSSLQVSNEKTTKDENSKMLINEETSEQSVERRPFDYEALAKEVTELRTLQEIERQEFTKHMENLKSENVELAKQVEKERCTRVTTEFSYFLNEIEKKGVTLPSEKSDLIAFCLSVEGHSFSTQDGNKKNGFEFMKNMLSKLTPVVELGTMFPKSEDFSNEKPNKEEEDFINGLTNATNLFTKGRQTIVGKS